MQLTKRQSARIDRWLAANMDGTHTVSYAVDGTRAIAFPKLPDTPLVGKDFKALADHVRGRCAALGLPVKRLDYTQHLTATGNAVCDVCGLEFVPHKASAKRCPMCRMRNRKPRRPRAEPVALECQWCGSAFSSKSRTAKYCSDACRRAAKNDRGRMRYEERREGMEPSHALKEYGKRRCAECGQWFTMHSPNASYCSDTCRKLVKARQRKRARYYHQMNKD